MRANPGADSFVQAATWVDGRLETGAGGRFVKRSREGPIMDFGTQVTFHQSEATVFVRANSCVLAPSKHSHSKLREWENGAPTML